MSCERYDAEALTGFPTTPAFLEHLKGCADCQTLEGKYERLGKLIAVAGLDAVPPSGFEQRLQARIATAPRRTSRVPMRAVAAAASLLAAGLVVWVAAGQKTAADSTIDSQVLPGGKTRSMNAAVGDAWQLTIGRDREVRVWLNRTTLIGRCSAALGTHCTLVDGRLQLKLPLDVAGEYRAAVFTPGASGLDEPQGFDHDMAAAATRGATVQPLEPLKVY